MTNTTATIALATALLTGFGTLAGAQGTVKLTTQPESKLTVSGSSNIHDWKCSSSSIDATIEADAAILRDAPRFPALVRKVALKLPVTSLKCGDDRMDKNLYKALNAEKLPAISYVLGTFEIVSEAENGFATKAVGKLTIAGSEKTVTMDVLAERLPSGALRATGTVPLLMTDFGIKPPTALLGTLRTKNEITVKFELIVDEATMAAARER
jgi:hypothetical protein